MKRIIELLQSEVDYAFGIAQRIHGISYLDKEDVGISHIDSSEKVIAAVRSFDCLITISYLVY